MRVAIEGSTWVNARGYGRFTRELTRALLRAGSPHEFTLVVDSGAAAAPDLPDMPLLCVPTRHAVVDTATSDRARSPGDMWRMAAAMSRGRFDAIVFPTNYSFVPVWRGPYVIVVVHDALPETMPELVLGSRKNQLLWSLKSRLACWRADRLATVSHASAREIVARLPVRSNDLAILTEGIAPHFSPSAGPDDDRLVAEATRGSGPYVLFVGGISPHKRVPDLIRAFGHVAARPEWANLRLVLAGPHGLDGFEADQANVTGAIRDIGEAGRRVLSTGFVSDETLAALYRQATCVVLPSSAEGFGLPALEAMASGTPLIVARTPALEEVCGPAAVYVDEPAALPEALERLLADSTRRAELREAGLARARLFGWDEGARRLLEALDRAPAARAPRAVARQARAR